MTVSQEEIYVNEGSMPAKVLCSAKSFPEPNYIWKGKDGATIGTGNALIVNKALYRKDAGIYTCVAKNKHGSSEAEFSMNIRCKFLLLYHFIYFPYFFSHFIFAKFMFGKM